MVQMMKVMLWKSFTLRKRQWKISLVELVTPIVLFWLFVNNTRLLSNNNESIVYDGDPNYYIRFGLLDDIQYKLAYAPFSNLSASIMERVFKKLNSFPNTQVTLVNKSSENDVVAWLGQQTADKTGNHSHTTYSVGIGVIFSNPDEMENLQYTLRTTEGDLKTTEDSLYGVEDGYDDYKRSGFSTIQAAIDQAYLSHYHNISVPYNILVKYLPYVHLESVADNKCLFYLMISLSFVCVMPSLLKNIVEEKTSGTKEMMKIMGLKGWMNWMNWVVYSWFVLIPVTLAESWMLTTDVDTGPIINASFFTIWILFLMSTLAFVTLIFAVSTFFTNRNIGLIVGLMLWYVLTILLNWFFVNNPDKFGMFINTLTCLWPSAALQWCINAINNFHVNGHTWTISNLFDDGAGGGRVSVGLALIMLLVDILLFSIITWYIDNVNPGPYGRAKPFGSIFQYFKKKCYDSKSFNVPVHPKNYETPPKDGRVGIQIVKLRKTFNKGQVVAVDDVDLDIYEGNITALLGHTGAGKTTAMYILTGFTSPTRGKVIVKDQNIFDNMDKFRSCLGLCPQYNSLFSFFTVWEHLIFFGMLKGLSKSQSEKEGMELLKLMKMEEKKNQLVSKLSGGMKRKLCLSIALMGNPDILILDEPTSGLEPESRQQVWNVILSFRRQRTTIITTHFMEEADVLADRIAIMDHGQVSCYGTSKFLKNLYNTGYRLNILKLEQADEHSITKVMKKHTTSATLKLSTPSQLSYTINSDESSQFPALFSELEASKGDLGLTGMGISCSTLEDVFLKVADNVEPNVQKNNECQEHKTVFKNYKKSSGAELFFSQLRALVYVKFLTRIRSWITTIIYIVCPVIVMAFTVSLTSEQNSTSNQPNLPIRLSSFPGAHVAVSAENQNVSNVIQNLVRSGGGVPDIVPTDTTFNNYLGRQINNSIIQYEREMVAGFIYSSSNLLGAVSFYTYHSPALVLNMIANILLQQTSPTSSISISNHPIGDQLSLDACYQTAQAFIHVSFFPSKMALLSISLMSLAMGFIMFPLKERVSNTKQLQLKTGVSPLLYWFTNFLCDFILYIVIALLMISTVYIFQHNNIYSASGYIGILTVVFCLFGISGIAFAYLFSFVKSLHKVTILFILINGITGTFASVIFAILNIEHLSVYVFLLSFNPIFAASSAVMHLFSAMYIDGTCLQCGTGCETKDPLQFGNDGILNFLAFLIVDAILYFGLVLAIEYGTFEMVWFSMRKSCMRMNKKKTDDDCDMLIEKEEVSPTQEGDDVITTDLDKNSKRTAVYEVSLQVGREESIGLQEMNDAEKTSTFKMLTGEEKLNKEDATILELSLEKQKSNFLVKIGYSPQFDAINNLLTSKEMLRVYALLRGIPSTHCDAEVARWINIMGLKEYADRPCSTYSAGNKRKLRTAMAFIGEPPVVFLDKATSGIDPVSRRKLWDVVSNMEKCEDLSSQLTIMMAGQLKCIGSTEFLKHEFGQGFTIKIKLHSSPNGNDVDALKKDMISVFGTCFIKNEHLGFLHYQVPYSQTPLSVLFTKMEGLKMMHGIIEDYNVTNTTLEQVFMFFA